MTGNYIDFSEIGISGKIIRAFKTNIEIETTVITKDSRGNGLPDIEFEGKS